MKRKEEKIYTHFFFCSLFESKMSDTWRPFRTRVQRSFKTAPLDDYLFSTLNALFIALFTHTWELRYDILFDFCSARQRSTYLHERKRNHVRIVALFVCILQFDSAVVIISTEIKMTIQIEIYIFHMNFLNYLWNSLELLEMNLYRTAERRMQQATLRATHMHRTRCHCVRTVDHKLFFTFRNDQKYLIIHHK